MKASNTKLVLTLILFTAGVALMLVGMPWLTFFGLGLIVLSDSYASGRQSGRMALWLCGVGVVSGLMRHHFLSRTPLEWWYMAALIGVWLFGVLYEWRRWRANRRYEL